MASQDVSQTPDDSRSRERSCDSVTCCCMIGTGSKVGLLLHAASAAALLGLIAYGFLSAV